MDTTLIDETVNATTSKPKTIVTPVNKHKHARHGKVAQCDPAWMKVVLICLSLVYLIVLVIFPLVLVFVEAFSKGVEVYWRSISDPMAIDAIKLTLTISLASVTCNLLFGLSAAWAVTKFRFRAKTLLVTLIDLPFSVSPVVSGLIYVLLFGARGWVGPWLQDHNLKDIFAWPGIFLATTFVTFPFIAREVIPLMESQGRDEEYAALTLGGSGWSIFWHVTLPNIRWGLLYAVVLCNARAMGEFGAVSVVSGHIRGSTNTIPLQVELLYNEYASASAFSLASLLALIAIVTLGFKSWVEHRTHRKTRK